MKDKIENKEIKEAGKDTQADSQAKQPKSAPKGNTDKTSADTPKTNKDAPKNAEAESKGKSIRERILEKATRKRPRYRREEKEVIWVPKTKLGRLVKEKKIKDIDEIFDKGLHILEPEIVDSLLPIESDLLSIGQSKGKAGGGKRRAWRQTQKKTAEENVSSFACMTVVGDSKGHVGLGYGKARETLPAREKAMRDAKLNLIRIKRSCGSFDCACKEEHSIPFKVEGKSGSVRIILMPAPKGTGPVIEDECKKILKLAGIKDIYSRTFGKTKTKFNLAIACMKALEKTTKLIIK